MSQGAGPPLRRAARAIRRRVSRRALILLYHRVGESACDPWDLFVTPAHFAEHLDVLRSFGRVMAVRDLAAAVQRGRLPRRSIVVTFDDGYADNLLHAKPLLERHQVPATVFVTSGATNLAEEFWWDELERILLSPGSLPDALDLVIDERAYHWSLDPCAQYETASADAHRKWRTWRRPDPTPRHTIYRELWQVMRLLSTRQRDPIRAALRRWGGAVAAPRPTHRVLTSDEIVTLAQDGLVEIGCHTVSHPLLSGLGVAAQQDEVQRSKRDLEAIVDTRVTTFAYPFGDHSAETVRIVREAGFVAAGTTTHGLVEAGADEFRLPRRHVRDMNGEAFARTIHAWIEGD